MRIDITKAFWALVVAVAPAFAASVNLTVTSGGSDTVAVTPGGVVNYDVTAVLSDTNNEGLAGIIFNLSFTGGPLTPATEPAANPMLNFDRPAGLTNPAGFGGTVIGSDLIQVGGAQNTIKNTIATAPAPVGTVITDVAQTPVIIVSGSLTAPMVEGSYTLSASGLMATVISPGETGAGEFWAVEAAAAGSIGNLTVVVAGTTPLDGQGEGSRYIAINPPSGTVPVALLVTGDPLNGAVSCLSSYVQADGTLAPAAVFRTPAEWGAVIHVGDSEILPDTTYRVQSDYNTPGGPDLSPPVALTSWKWGDVNNSGIVNLDDILCVLSGFSATFTNCSLYADDLMGTTPNRIINLDDILAVLNAFGGTPYGGAAPCP